MRKQNPFAETEVLVAPLFRLKHMPVSLFSINERLTKETTAEHLARVAVTEDDIKEYLNKSHPEKTLIQEDPLPKVDLSEAYELL